MIKKQNSKQYDLEDRTYIFAKNCRIFIYKVSKNICVIEDSKQLARYSGSVAANYIEANESLSKKDFVHRIKISRKEAKESRLWLNLINTNDSNLIKYKEKLIDEATQLMKIFGSIIEKSK